VSSRLKTSIWVDAFLRTAMVNGHFGAVIHKGAEEAGSVLLVVNRLDGSHDILETPPGPAYTEEGVRRFVKTNTASLPWPDVSTRIAKRRGTDPDLWVVEVEDRNDYGGAQIAVE
jgi:hypothetical protein